MIDNTTRQLVQCARDEIEMVFRSLGHAASGGSRSKPTIKQLSAMVVSLENAKRFTAAALATPPSAAKEPAVTGQYDSGVKAEQAGVKWRQNPNPSGSTAAYEWDKGHIDARRLRRAQERR